MCSWTKVLIFETSFLTSVNADLILRLNQEVAINKIGTKVAIFEGEMKIDRIKFGMKPITSVGDEVQIKFYCELIKN